MGPETRTWAELMQQVCAGVGLLAHELPRRAVGGALRDYCWRAARVRVATRLGSRRYHDYYEVRSARRGGRAGLGERDLAKLREVLGPFVTHMHDVLWADPYQRQLPSPADDQLVVPILVPPAHEELVRELVRGLVERARPGTFPEASARQQEEERARAWLTRNADRLRACAAVLGRDAVIQVLGR